MEMDSISPKDSVYRSESLNIIIIIPTPRMPR